MERLEVPRSMRTKLASRKISSSVNAEECVFIKFALILFGPAHAADQGKAGNKCRQPANEAQIPEAKEKTKILKDVVCVSCRPELLQKKWQKVYFHYNFLLCV